MQSIATPRRPANDWHAGWVLVGDKGPMARLEEAKRDGLTRFVGGTGHNRPEKFARVLARRRIDVMMNAVNIVDRHTYSFETLVWPRWRR